ncbi:MAG: DUF2806 domain-containing protein, partial [Rheinheimera sp.]
MSKVQTLSVQQRLRQLAKRQLGSDLASTKVQSSTVTNHAVDAAANGSFNDKHKMLSSRAGVPLAEQLYPELSLAERSARRLQMRVEQQQQNLERVITLALNYCTEQITAQDVDPDWFQFYCELVQNISTHSMQKLWAKILAGEISSPGSFSLKTLNLLKQMSY